MSITTAVTAPAGANQQPFRGWLFFFIQQFLTSKHFVVAKRVISPGTRKAVLPARLFGNSGQVYFPSPGNHSPCGEEMGPGRPHMLCCFCQLERAAEGSRLLPSAATTQGLISSQLAAGICAQPGLGADASLGPAVHLSFPRGSDGVRKIPLGLLRGKLFPPPLLCFLFPSHRTSHFLLFSSGLGRDSSTPVFPQGLLGPPFFWVSSLSCVFPFISTDAYKCTGPPTALFQQSCKEVFSRYWASVLSVSRREGVWSPWSTESHR